MGLTKRVYKVKLFRENVSVSVDNFEERDGWKTYKINQYAIVFFKDVPISYIPVYFSVDANKRMGPYMSVGNANRLGLLEKDWIDPAEIYQSRIGSIAEMTCSEIEKVNLKVGLQKRNEELKEHKHIISSDVMTRMSSLMGLDEILYNTRVVQSFFKNGISFEDILKEIKSMNIDLNIKSIDLVSQIVGNLREIPENVLYSTLRDLF